MSNAKLELALIEEMRQLLKKEEVMSEAVELLDHNLEWTLRYCEKNRIPMPERERILASLLKLRGLLDSFYSPSPESKQEDDFDLDSRGSNSTLEIGLNSGV